MSLKWFHVVFITASAGLAAFMTVWAFATGAPAVGAIAIAGGGALLVYQKRFLQMARRIGLK